METSTVQKNANQGPEMDTFFLNTPNGEGLKNHDNVLDLKIISSSSIDSKDKNEALSGMEIPLQVINSPLPNIFFKATSDRMENCETVNNERFTGNAIGLVIGDGKNPNDFSIQLISIEKLRNSESQHNGTIEKTDLMQCTPITLESPSYEAPVAEVRNELKTVFTEENETKFERPYKCDICERTFTRAFAVVRHKRNVHDIDVPTASVVRCKAIQRKFWCRICKTPFLTAVDRMNHEKTVHKLCKFRQSQQFQCSECSSTFYGRQMIVEHISETHTNINMRKETFTFKSFDEFKKWKLKVEKDTKSEYIREKLYKSKRFSVLKYVCHRSGTFKSRSSGKRSTKFSGSNKTGFYCPSTIQVKTPNTDNNNLEVDFVSTHLGHEFEIQRLNMEKRLKFNHTANLHKCRVCGKFYTTSSNRKLHEREVHNLNEAYDLKLKCPKCFSVFPSKKKIMSHFSKFHDDVDLKTSSETFKSLKEFEEWKLSIEKATKSEYVLDLNYHKKKCSVQRYTCYLNESSETGSFCPASMLVKSHPIDKTIDVTYQRTHVGHKIEVTCVQVAELSSTLNDNVKKSHQKAEKVADNVNITRNDENTWTIFPLFETETYQVKKLDIDLTHICCLKCHSCNICQHQFTCNCSNSHGICIHIHIVCLRYFQVVEEDVDNSCNVDDIQFSDHESTNELENDVLQEIGENQQFITLRDQAVVALSSLHTAVNECRDETKLRELIKGLLSLKDKMSVSIPSTSPQVIHAQKHSPLKVSSLHLNQPNILRIKSCSIHN